MARKRWGVRTFTGPAIALTIVGGIVAFIADRNRSAPPGNSASSLSRMSDQETILFIASDICEASLGDSMIVSAAAEFNELKSLTGADAAPFIEHDMPAQVWSVPNHPRIHLRLETVEESASEPGRLECTVLASGVDGEKMLARLRAEDFLGEPGGSGDYVDTWLNHTWPPEKDDDTTIRLATEFLPSALPFDLKLQVVMPRPEGAPPFPPPP